MRTGLAVSSVGHAIILGWGLVAFAPAAFDTPPAESMPVDLVPISELTQLQAGSRDAPKKEQPKQEAKKEGEAKRAPEENKPKQPEVKTAAAPPPEPEPKPEPVPQVKEEPKPEPKQEVAAPLPPKRQPPPPRPKTPPVAKSKQREFNPDQIAALLDRRQPNAPRAAEQLSDTGAFGASTGNAPRLTQSEIDALRAQIQACWNPPVGAADARDLVVLVRVQFRTDGTLASEPQVVNRGSSPYFQVAAESATRAVRRCQPYTLPAAKYEVWRDVEVTFDPRDMFGG